MRLKWLLNPLIGYARAVAARTARVARRACGLALRASRFGAERELAQARAMGRESHDTREPVEAALANLRSELESLRESVRRLEAAPPPQAPRIAAGLNLTKRAQVVRMHRRGEPVSSIAAALETPGNEIELLLKVHAMTGERQSKAS
jgi:septal ring factor EnvC (AmiA/AmiB activator)